MAPGPWLLVLDSWPLWLLVFNVYPMQRRFLAAYLIHIYIYMGALGEGSGWYIYLRVRPAAPAGIWKSGNLRTWKCENPPIYTLLVGVWGLTLLRMAHIAISSGRSTLELKTEND